MGSLVFRLDEEGPVGISHPKQLPSCLDLYLVTYIPEAPTDKGVVKTSASNFKAHIRNLRSGQNSVTHSSNLRTISIQELAHFSGNLYEKFKASLTRVGNISPGVTPRLSLIGLEETRQDNSAVGFDHGQAVGDNQDGGYGQTVTNAHDQAENITNSAPRAFEDEYQRPKRVRRLPEKLKQYNLFTSAVSTEIEQLFLSQDFSQNAAILRALQLHLYLCQGCNNCGTYKYLVDGKLEKSPQIYIPYEKIKKTSHGRRIRFDKIIKCSDDTEQHMKSFSVILEPGKFDKSRLYFDFDISMKEIGCLKSCKINEVEINDM